MPSYIVRSRSTSPWEDQTVEATSRDAAIHVVLDAADEGVEVEVCNVVEADAGTEPAAKKAAPAATASGAKPAATAHHR